MADDWEELRARLSPEARQLFDRLLADGMPSWYAYTIASSPFAQELDEESLALIKLFLPGTGPDSKGNHQLVAFFSTEGGSQWYNSLREEERNILRYESPDQWQYRMDLPETLQPRLSHKEAQYKGRERAVEVLGEEEPKRLGRQATRARGLVAGLPWNQQYAQYMNFREYYAQNPDRYDSFAYQDMQMRWELLSEGETAYREQQMAPIKEEAGARTQMREQAIGAERARLKEREPEIAEQLKYQGVPGAEEAYLRALPGGLSIAQEEYYKRGFGGVYGDFLADLEAQEQADEERRAEDARKQALVHAGELGEGRYGLPGGGGWDPTGAIRRAKETPEERHRRRMLAGGARLGRFKSEADIYDFYRQEKKRKWEKFLGRHQWLEEYTEKTAGTRTPGVAVPRQTRWITW